MSKYLSRRFDDMRAYTPGEQPQDRSYIKLNTNESPFPPAPGVLDALSRDEAGRLNLYPDPDTRVASAALAASFGLTPERMILGNGSDEILAFCFLAFCDPETPAVFADITYGFYEVFARVFCVPSRVVPLDDQLRIDPKRFCPAGGTLFLANPNAPTGQALELGAIEDILRENPRHVVVIDEAYAAFGAQSVIPLIARYENLVVVQTMSKSRNLAGARIGYAVGNPALISDLNQMKFSFNPYNVNRLSLLAAAAAVRDTGYYETCVGAIKATRAATAGELARRGFTVLPSAANFLFARPNFMGGEAYYLALKERGVLVRHFRRARIDAYVRITIGTEDQMRALLIATDAIMRESA
ncbi:MAG: histidinol-phosphate transaminase [Clostridiales bacterium]|jgi:histidinol-phosphate aminotransferase|nr:histidinol-phosphate transaminase [Clostridiales bacterium]